MRKHKGYWMVFLILLGISLVLNMLARTIPGFADGYIKYVYPIFVNTLGRMNSLVPFSVGEILIVMGILLVIAAVILIPFGLICSRGKIWGKAKKFYGFFVMLLNVIFLVQTLNCFILYQGTTLESKMVSEEGYEVRELIALREEIVSKLNELGIQMKRNSQGDLVYDEEEMKRKCIEAMKKLGEEYPQLQGYYPNPKKLYFSEFASQQYLSGIFFPFSMEANYNGVMYASNYPATVCHELSHLKGVILEDEANFYAYLACIQSEDLFFQYSGYLSVFYYVENDLLSVLSPEEYQTLTQAASYVYQDDIFLKEETWEEIEEEAVLDTETVDEISDALTEKSLNLNGVEDGMQSYSRVVKLLLAYYHERTEGKEHG
ncbi:MAG: DUF3810 domain-containing protein [Lachnospiraceae bacterium]|nr:DUF3810 domain-containing protein [Lachnospiraceae bacterium]